MNEIIIDKFLLVTPTEHVIFHDKVLLHIQSIYCDMARMVFKEDDFISFRKLVNEIYLSEDTLGRGMDRVTYSKVLKFVALRTFENYIFDLDILNNLFIRVFSLELMVPTTMIERAYFLLAKISTCLSVLETLLAEEELSIVNHCLRHSVEKLRRTAESNSYDVWQRIWTYSQSVRSDTEGRQSVLAVDTFKSKRKGHV